jgi:hypothetical protein
MFMENPKIRDPQCQALCFFAACICLMLCSTGEPGTPFVLSFAVVGRLCLDVCFATIYVALAQIFAGRASKVAFTTCETTARVDGIIAPSLKWNMAHIRATSDTAGISFSFVLKPVKNSFAIPRVACDMLRLTRYRMAHKMYMSM